jgi:hypothetical protein
MFLKNVLKYQNPFYFCLKEKNDPLDAAVFYLAMKKKSLVWGLYRSVRDEKMTSFFSNNFTEDRLLKLSDSAVHCRLRVY